MNNNKQTRPLFRGELALAIAVALNSFGVVLMLYSGSGISAISSVPYAFSEVFPFLSLGTWTYLFQGGIDSDPDGAAAAVCGVVPVQLCGGICVQSAAGCA